VTAVPTISVIDAYLGGCELQVNLAEEPHGTNDGPMVRPIQATTGNKPPDPWCASAKAHVGVCILGKRWPLPLTASCNELAMAAIRRGVFRCTPVVYADLLAHGLFDAAKRQVIAPADVAQRIGGEAVIVGPPQRGDLALEYSLSLHHFHHAAAVRELLAGGERFGTYEGNTVKPGAKGDPTEGWGYFKKDHALADPWAWVRWVSLLEA